MKKTPTSTINWWAFGTSSHSAPTNTAVEKSVNLDGVDTRRHEWRHVIVFFFFTPFRSFLFCGLYKCINPPYLPGIYHV